MRHFLGTCSLVAACVTFAISGCDVPADPNEAKLDEPEQLNAAQQEVGKEAACATVVLSNNDIGTSVVAPSGSSGVSAYSTDDRYGSTSCPRQWILEATSWNTGSHNLPDVILDTQTTYNASSCGSTNYQINYYGYNGTTWTGWRVSRDCYGNWVPVGGGGACEFSTNCTTTEVTPGAAVAFGNSTYTKIRAAIQAWRWEYTQPSVTRVDYKVINAAINGTPP